MDRIATPFRVELRKLGERCFFFSFLALNFIASNPHALQISSNTLAQDAQAASVRSIYLIWPAMKAQLWQSTDIEAAV